MVANSLTVSNKAETGEGRYNLRVVECRLAAIVIALALDYSKVSLQLRFPVDTHAGTLAPLCQHAQLPMHSTLLCTGFVLGISKCI